MLCSTNPSVEMEKLYGDRIAGCFGYSHLTGGYAGGQAEYVRVINGALCRKGRMPSCWVQSV